MMWFQKLNNALVYFLNDWMAVSKQTNKQNNSTTKKCLFVEVWLHYQYHGNMESS